MKAKTKLQIVFLAVLYCATAYVVHYDIDVTATIQKLLSN
jgi:hypothetical protein